MKVTLLIPARLASTRLPNKPLADIAGLPMIVRVAQRVSHIEGLDARVVVATDSEQVMAACAQHGVEALLTDADHPSGSDRLAQACTLLGLGNEEVVVNVQGDEPLIDPQLVQAVAELLDRHPDAAMSTAAHPIDRAEDFANPNVVKVVTDASGHALYFSRAPIPHWRDRPDAQTLPTHRAMPAPLRHIGIYAYRVGFLKQFPGLTPAPLEQLEALEQLRALWHGHSIAVHLTPHAPGAGVDTPQDLARVRAYFDTLPKT